MSTEQTEKTEPWTVLRLLTWTTDFFKKKGSDTARLDAEVLLADARGCSRIELYTAFNTELEQEPLVAFRELVRRRGEGTPVAYLVGYKEFYSLKFQVNPSVLIPRPETEHLVIEALDRAKSIAGEGKLHIADVGTGSGAIAIAIAKNLPRARVAAIDKSEQALQVARENVERYELQDRIVLQHGDLLQTIKMDASLDMVCSNPPYISQAEYDALDPGVREQEPEMALLCGPKGTETIEALIPQAARCLKPGGFLIIELSPMIADACADILKANEAFAADTVHLIRDLAGHKRILSAQKAA
ncbi:Release factor glutamine methyltransferase [Roseimaritima multifibrata]|uniref:Release factor glutamine methyltransferase n=1 Tax=Roseimaritima multifibrata TaxID=1930274 RepID=A0A517MMS3_9BACT|nr:peptide chain release factor N(5)-glutamine methyltransferase [Roseimaritima multifibrata]QDS96172.1 Release factor glutamine methyltransferase [Roseimaritima multifibrata]